MLACHTAKGESALFGTALVLNGRIQLGVLLAYISYIGMLYGPIGMYVGIVERLMHSLGSSERVFKVLDERPRVADTGTEESEIHGDIQFENVIYGYSEKTKVIHKLNLKIHNGEKVYIKGKSGCGKSTLLALLLRFYEPQKGRILIDGLPIGKYSLSALRKNIGIVFQEPYLYNTTVRDNIKVGRVDATDQEMMKAAIAANAHRFVSDLPNGYDTIVGSRGANLSGGERQRVAIARIFLRDPAIVLLDEVTSALDADAERLVAESIDRLLKDRTCIVVTHRDSMINNGKRTIYIDS